MSTAVAAPSPLIQEPMEEYQAKAKENLTSHQLGDFRRCPLLYHKKKLGLIPDEDRPAYLVGRALHTLVLEGRDKFEEEYAVGGPINPKTGDFFGPTTKAFAKWAAEQGNDVLTVAQFDLVVWAHHEAMDLLSTGVAEGVVRAEYCDVPCQIRLDWCDCHRAIVDLKTCDDLTWFEADAKRYGYVYQMAFYQAVLAKAIAVLMPVYLVGVEKQEPFRCGVWKLSDDVLARARQDNETFIGRLKWYGAAEIWPSGYEDCRVFDSI